MATETIEQPAVGLTPEAVKGFMDSRDAGKPIEPAADKPKEADKPAAKADDPHVSRSQRRQLNGHRRLGKGLQPGTQVLYRWRGGHAHAAHACALSAKIWRLNIRQDP